MVGVCSTFAFATETTVKELKNCSKNEKNAKRNKIRHIKNKKLK